eukprot:8452415-Heterocapsa_arctica.AAC.1
MCTVLRRPRRREETRPLIGRVLPWERKRMVLARVDAMFRLVHMRSATSFSVMPAWEGIVHSFPQNSVTPREARQAAAM